MIEEIGGDFKVKPTVSYKPVPKDFKPATVPIDASVDYLSKADETMGEFKLFAMGLLIAGVVFLLAYLVIGWLVIGNAKKRLDSMGNAASKLASAIEDNAGSSGGGAAAFVAEQKSAQAAVGDSSDKDTNIFADLEDDSLLAILTDCYWCSKDEYTSFIWSKIPTSSKSRLLEKLSFLGEYVSYTATLGGNDLGFANDLII